MADLPDFLVVGAGLAGSFAAFRLAASGRTLLIDAEGPAGGASGAAIGVVNTFMARKARTIWRYDEAEAALDALLGDSGLNRCFHRTGVWRPAEDAAQAGYFVDSASAHPDRATFLGPEAVEERFPDVRAPFGALFVRSGGWMDIAATVADLVDAAQSRFGMEVCFGERLIGWTEGPDQVAAHLQSGRTVEARHIVLTVGYGYRGLAPLTGLSLHDVKGQSNHLLAPRELAARLPCLSGAGHIVADGETLLAGSTYEHRFEHVFPTEAGSKAILQKIGSMVPAVDGLEVIRRDAGVRVTVPGTRLPMVGPLPGSERVWVLLGLGTKGILMAALLSSCLPGYLRRPDSIPPEIGVRTMPAG